MATTDSTASTDPTVTTSPTDALAQALRPFSPGSAPEEVPSPPVRWTARLASGVATGTLAGMLGVAAMTVAMEIWYHLLPPEERWPLEPSLIVSRLTAQTPVETSENTHQLLTLAAHAGYGATSGVAYALTLGNAPLPAPLKGVGFGLGLFAASYLGWLPAAGVLRPASDFPARRNAGLIAAHLVYGSVTALATRALMRNRWRRFSPVESTPARTPGLTLHHGLA